MKKTKIALIFLSGLLSGGIGGYILALKKPIHEKLFVSPSNEFIKNFKEGFDKGYQEALEEHDSCGLNDAHDILVEQSKNNKYITLDDISIRNMKSDGDEIDASEIQAGSWEDSDNDRSDVDRKHLSDIIRTQNYNSKSDAKQDIEGDLHLVKEKDISDEVDKSYVRIVGPADFVKAIANEAKLYSFIFNTLDQNFYWNFTEELLPIDEAKEILSDEVVEEILNESNYNANRWIQTRYLYNVTFDVYIKIECHAIVSQNRPRI